MSYDFSQLSSLDFEDLCRDLLQAETGETLETFKPGRDQGIDIRLLKNNKKTIIQCKHYLKSGISTLLSKLKKEEVDKVKKLSPNRYIFCTSLPLTAKNKSDIKELFQPYIKNDHDVIGQESLNNLLNLHKEIETQHFKLWLSGTTVLSRVLNNAVETKSEYLVERVKSKLPLFVENASFPKVLKILNEHRVAIISGDPGVGKTTLAEMILYHFIGNDFRAIEVGLPRDAFDTYKADIPTIYYYDDFLGLTYYGDKFDKNADVDIIHLINLIKNSKNSHIILTSRDYILNQASQSSERFENSNLFHDKYRLEISSYTKIDKAKILYNHLFFSELEDEYIDEIVNTKTYNSIINHENYIPRVIEWVTGKNFVKNISPKEYPDFFIETLNNPKKLWKKPFEKQISAPARNLLLALLSMGGKADASKLHKVFNSYHSYACGKYNLRIRPEDFNNASEEVLGSFITTEDNFLMFANPSLKDFLELWVLSNKSVILDLLSAATKLKQCQIVWLIFSIHPAHEELFLETQETFITNLKRLKNSPPNILERHSQSQYLINNDLSYPYRLHLYLNLFAKFKNLDLLNLMKETLDSAISANPIQIGYIDDWVDVGVNMLEKLDRNVLINSILVQISNIIVSFIKGIDNINDFYCLISALDTGLINKSNKERVKETIEEFIENQVEDEIWECNNSTELNDFKMTFESVIEYFEINADMTISHIDGKFIAIDENEAMRADYDQEVWRERRYEEKYEEQEEQTEQQSIDDYFQNLDDR